MINFMALRTLRRLRFIYFFAFLLFVKEPYKALIGQFSFFRTLISGGIRKFNFSFFEFILAISIVTYYLGWTNGIVVRKHLF